MMANHACRVIVTDLDWLMHYEHPVPDRARRLAGLPLGLLKLMT
jgi:hypothetical protein